MSMAWCQIKPINVNFHLKKVWKFLIKIQLTKSDQKMTRGWKVPSLMPIKVKELNKNLNIKQSIALLQILLGRGIHIDFSSQLKFAKIGFYGAFHL